MESIKIENLSFTYPSKTAPALDNISLSLKKGEFVTLCGKSGCGKSTLLRQLKPLISPYGERAGTILFDEKAITELSQYEQAKNIGFVMQNPDNQIVCDKVWHELAFGLENLSYPQNEIRIRVAEMAAFFGIGDLFYKNVSELSGGEKQLLNLAAVMAGEPSLLILDEPTSQLDPAAASEFLGSVQKINRELGVTVIISEQRLEEVLPISDRVIVMENGRIIADGTVREVGSILKQSESDMLFALPTPMRVFYSLSDNEECPVTVRDGRAWLEKQIIKSMTFSKREKPSEKVILQAKDLWFRYEKELPDILKGLSLKIYEGELYAIVGGNGAGKTTTLSAIVGINKPYRGKVTVEKGKRIAALPQNPTSLFVKKTVLAELWEMLDGDKADKPEKEEKIRRVIDFCELEELVDAHPYDLSGGEQQRAALAKVLLTEPDILLLDEPTKGLDAHFKIKLAGLIKALQKNGVTVIMVSHDIEFCARYADRVGMFFDGKIVSENTPREFFSGKSVYTTSANRMSRGMIEKAVLDEDIIEAIGGKADFVKPFSTNELQIKKPNNNIPIKQERAKMPTLVNILLAALFLLIFFVTEHFFGGKYSDWKGLAVSLAEILAAGGALWNLLPKKRASDYVKKTERKKARINKRTVAAAFAAFILVPLTIYIGATYLGDRKYYFISMLIILEIILPFVLAFEGRKPQARELVIIAVLCAISVTGRVAFAPLPQFKPVTALVIISGVCLGAETGFLVGAMTAFVSNFYFSQGAWTPWQMFSWGIIGFLAGVIFGKGLLGRNRPTLCIFGFFATLIIYGGIMNPASVIMMQMDLNYKALAAAYIAALPLDLIHASSTAFFLWFAARPMCERLERIKSKYGLL